MSPSSDPDNDSSSSSSESEDSQARKKRLKKEEKKVKKKEKKQQKKEKKKLKKEKKLAKKEGTKKEKNMENKTKDDRKRDRSSSFEGKPISKEAKYNCHVQKQLQMVEVQKKRLKKNREGSPERDCDKPALKYVEFDWESLLDVCERAARDIKEVNATIEDDKITVHHPDGYVIEKPEIFNTFKEIREFPRRLQYAFEDAGFPGPSQIQSYCWPLGLQGKDIIGIAATGSGKTLAFLLPAFVEMNEESLRPERDGPGLLVMSPTRELAQQIETEGNKFGKCLGMRCVAMYGGSSKGSQLSRYRQGCVCMVACPGRLNDCLDAGQVQVKNARRLVLDEADRMLDMGFEPQIRKILTHVPMKRHTLFFTATWPKEIRMLASEILTRPYKVTVGNRDELKANSDVTQLVKIVSASSKVTALHEMLMDAGLAFHGGMGKALVFCGSKRTCEDLNVSLQKMDVPCASIHGDKDQRERDLALADLKKGNIKVLVGTDVAARGLDIKGVGLVVNFDPPNNAEDYVHRIGRTGRAGAKGVAVALLTPDEGNKARHILKVMESTGQGGPPELHALAATAGSGKGASSKGGGKRQLWKVTAALAKSVHGR